MLIVHALLFVCWFVCLRSFITQEFPLMCLRSFPHPLPSPRKNEYAFCSSSFAFSRNFTWPESHHIIWLLSLYRTFFPDTFLLLVQIGSSFFTTISLWRCPKFYLFIYWQAFFEVWFLVITNHYYERLCKHRPSYLWKEM